MVEYLLNISDGSQIKGKFPVVTVKVDSESTFFDYNRNFPFIWMLVFCLCILANRVRFYIFLWIRRERE